jgi:hypothetical protein
MPGSGGWVEVVLDDVRGGRVRVGVRTAAGETLAFPRSVVAGERVPFRLDADVYGVEIARLHSGLFSRDFAELHLRKLDSWPATGEQEAAAGQALSLGTKVLDLIEPEFARFEAHTRRAEASLMVGNLDEAGAAIRSALRSAHEARQGVRWLQELTGEELMGRHLSVIEDLSLLKVRVLSPRRELDPVQALADSRDTADQARGKEALGRLMRITVGALGFPEMFAQSIEAQVLEAHTVGSRYAFGTRNGRRSAFEKRPGLERGRTVEVHLWMEKKVFPGVEGLQSGEECWVAVTPPVALKALPRAAGDESGRTWVTFVMRATEP